MTVNKNWIEITLHCTIDVFSTLFETVDNDPRIKILSVEKWDGPVTRSYRPHRKSTPRSHLANGVRSVDVILGKLRGAHPKGMSAEELGSSLEKLGLKKQSASPRMAELRKQGLVERSPDQSDLWQLTTKGMTS